MVTDPYQAPESNPAPVSGSSEMITVPPLVEEHLRSTRPWVKFCSITGYVGAGFLFLIALFFFRGMLESNVRSVLIGGFYLILAILFLIPSRYLSRYEKSITHLTISHRLTDLEQALADQRGFWRQMGIMILVLLVIYLLTIAFSAMVILSRGVSV